MCQLLSLIYSQGAGGSYSYTACTCVMPITDVYILIDIQLAPLALYEEAARIDPINLLITSLYQSNFLH